MEHGQDMELSPHPSVVMRALLIDLDNCPRQIERLPETLTEYARVIACYGGAEPKVPFGMVPLLATALHEGRLTILVALQLTVVTNTIARSGVAVSVHDVHAASVVSSETAAHETTAVRASSSNGP